MKKLLLVIASLSLACLSPPTGRAARGAKGRPAHRAAVEAYLNEITAQGRYGGAVLVARGGRVLLSRGYGSADLEAGEPNGPRSQFGIGTLTQQFTAAAVLMLQERGRLSVRNSVCKFLDGCPPAWRDVTLHHLLTHTSGVPDFAGPGAAAADEAAARARPLEFEPGSRLRHGETNYVLLGEVVARASGQSFETFVRRNILRPLKMNETAFGGAEAPPKGRAASYVKRGVESVRTPPRDDPRRAASSGLYSTVGDLFRWAEAFNAGVLVSRATLRAMLTAHKENFGYGWYVDEKFGLRRFSGGGAIYGYTSFLAHFPRHRTTIIVLSNHSTNPVLVAGRLTNILLGEHMTDPPARGFDPSALGDYVGRYVVESQVLTNFVIDITGEGGRLYFKPSHNPRQRLVPAGPDEFYDVDDVGDTVLHFRRDRGGRVSGLTVVENQDVVHASKTSLPPPSLRGNTTFRLKGYPEAKVVALAGSFNGWNQSELLFGRVGDEWVCRTDLAPGRYAYKFVIDGNWTPDPENPSTENDGAGNINSVIVVPQF